MNQQEIGMLLDNQDVKSIAEQSQIERDRQQEYNVR